MAALLAAYEWLFKQKPLPNRVVPIDTDAPGPTATVTPTSTSTATQTPTSTAAQTPTQLVSFQLLTPQDGETIPAMGKVMFSWGTMQGATLYRLEITMPNGTIIPFETEIRVLTATLNPCQWQGLIIGRSLPWIQSVQVYAQPIPSPSSCPRQFLQSHIMAVAAVAQLPMDPSLEGP